MTLDSLNCPHCGKTVWVNLGDLSDETIGDFDGAVCPYCDKTFPWPSPDDFETSDGDHTQGYKTPNEAAGVKP